MIEAEMLLLRDREFKIQQNTARSHTGKILLKTTAEEIQTVGTEDGWITGLLMQPPNVLDVNINDFGLFFFRSNFTPVRFALMAQIRKEMMTNVIKAFKEYPLDKLANKYACYYNNLFSIMSSLGGNDSKQAQNDGKRRRRETATSVDLFINLDDYDNCLAYIAK
jgi:hypothetical protein